MPSDFISLFSSDDLDLNSPRSLYSKESVYDLLPRELQLPSSSQQNHNAMSQKSGGEAGPPPSAALASDATVVSSSMTMGDHRSAYPTSSSSTSSASDQIPDHSGSSVDPEDNRCSRVVPEVLAAEGGNGNSGNAGNCRSNTEKGGGCGSSGGGGKGGSSQEASQQHHQTTPSKRRTVLNISPPPEDLLTCDDSHMSCQDGSVLDSEQSSSIWMDDSLSNFSVLSSASYNDNTEVPRKSRKRTPRQRPGPKPVSDASMDVFDADSAKGPHFVLSQLGSDSKGCPKGSSSEGPQPTTQKGGPLSVQYPQKCDGKELKILVQPETQHRARYLTEGSRGSVKDRTQQGFPTVKLEGVNEAVALQVFVGNDAGRVKPHGFYQACKVTGRNTTACKEVDVEGTTVIEVSLEPSTNMTLAVDCVGILKLRNADVEARIGVAGSKKKSTRARLVFRVNIPRPDGSLLTLQTPSCAILCTQPAGVPEILKKSLHTCSVRGGEELFIIGKNFLKDTKVMFQENVSDEQSWKVEAEIDMELFHQNHLVVKVPSYHNQAATSAVCVGIYVVTNAGRSHDVQPFTFTPDTVKADVSVKKESSSAGNPCSYDEGIKALDSALMTPMMPLVKQEEVTPMDISHNLQVFKSAEANSRSFSSNLPAPAGDSEKVQSAVFTNTEPLSTIQKQDIAAATNTFPVSADPLLQQGSQQFLLEPRDGLVQERIGGNTGAFGRLCGEPGSQQHQLPMFPPDEVAQLEQAVRQLHPEDFCSLPLQTDRQTDFCSLPLQTDSSLAKQQQCQQHIQQQQHIQKQQLQQQQQQQQIQQQQIQQQQIQQQQQQQQQIQKIQQQQQIQQQQIQQQQIQQQQQQVLDNLQNQIFQSQIPMQCGLFQGASQADNAEQQGSSQSLVSNRGSLFQQQKQQHQQAALFQQEILSIQTNFLQQTPSHTSPPLFHSPSSLTEARDPQGTLFHPQKTSHAQEQVQAALYQNLSPEQQPSTPSLFLPPTSMPSQLTTNSSQQQQQQQQLAFLSALQTPAPEPQSVFQAQTQMSPIQQGTPMEQHQPSQPQPLAQPPQQAPLFLPISPHSSANSLSQSQQQQAGLLFHSSPLSSPDQSTGLLFSRQGQIPPSSLASQEPPNPAMLFSQAGMVTDRQQDRSEPMALGNPAEPRQQVLFQEQQPMQLGRSSNNGPERPVALFMSQSNMATLQIGMATQELPQTTIFTTQNGLQATASSPVQQPGSLFQTAVNGTISQPNQSQPPGLFLFGIQNECSQMMNTGTTLSDQIIAISQSGQNQRESDARIQNLLSQSLSDAGSMLVHAGSMQNSMTVSENMEKIDDLLVSLQGSNLTRSY